MTARIFQPPKNAMQSGRANVRRWRLEYDQASAREIDPLMGWTSSGDMKQQLSLTFETKEEAVAFAEREGITYHLQEPKTRQVRPKSYAENFKPSRLI